MRQYELFEVKLQAPEPQSSRVDVNLKGIFEVNGNRTEVKGFYAGNGTWVVRFCPEEVGNCRYQISGTDGAGEKIGLSGSVDVEPAAPGRHGMVRPAGTHFQYADGTCFYPFGTTVYALSHQEDVLVERTFETLGKGTFNKVRMCVFPKHYDYNHNEPPCFAFEKRDEAWDIEKPNPLFWARLENHILRLDQMGIQCDLILFHPYDCWGFSRLSREEALIYLDYVARRLSAFPNVWWSLANEYDLMEYGMEEWEAFAKFLHENDPYGHLLSNHQIVRPWDFSNPYTTHICLQTSALDHVSAEIKKFGKPLIIDECCYEGNVPFGWGNISGFELVNRIWTVCMQGGYCTHGETFLNEEEILWWSKGGTLIGESPSRIRFLRELLESLPGPLTFSGRDYTEEAFEGLRANIPEEQRKIPFVRLLMKVSWDEAKGMLDSDREFAGNCGDEAYMKYYGRHCTCRGKLELPEENRYDVEVIDAWEMTRKTLLYNVSGEIEVELPGKEGIAVLARKVKRVSEADL